MSDQAAFGFTDSWSPSIQPKPQPWEGCSLVGETWRAYCEAFDANQMPGFSYGNYLGMVKRHRGQRAIEYLTHNVGIVRRDLAGAIRCRETIPDLLKV